MLTTEIEVIAKHKTSGKCYSSTMAVEDWYKLKRKSEYWYRAFEIGYYQNPKKIVV
jgi:hypothetical protein